MGRAWGWTIGMVVGLAAAATGAARAVDSDGDGIRDEHEKVLGTDPAHPEHLRAIIEDGVESEARRRTDTYDAAKDFTRVEFCHVGDDRYLWRITLAAAPRLEDTVLHLYVDADADGATGRQGPKGAASTGTEYMLSVVGGRATSNHYFPNGSRENGPPVSFVVDGNRVLMSADVDLARDEHGVRYALYVLCHTVATAGNRPAMSDSCGKRVIAGVPISKRPKILRPRDYQRHHRVQATFGLDVLRGVLRDEQTLAVPPDRLEMDGFVVDAFTSRRWAHVRRERDDGKVWTRAPRAGRYHVGFMMYDDSSDERVVIAVDGQVRGVAVANQDNNRTWLYWLEQPIAFRGGERVELEAAGSSGKHGICNILFLARTPEVRTIAYRIENMRAVADPDRPGRIIVSWTTTWPCPTRFEYGSDTSYGTTISAEPVCLVHRVVIDGLEPGTTYHGRAIGAARDGTVYFGEDFEFRAVAPEPPAGLANATVPLSVHNPHRFAADRWPVTMGIPFARGRLGSAKHVRLMRAGREVPVQVRHTARWPDGSIKWILVSFLADVPAGGRTEYALEFGHAVRPSGVGTRPLAAPAAGGVAIDTGSLAFRIDKHGNLTDFRRGDRALVVPGAACATHATDAHGTAYGTERSEAEITIEEAGPIRAVVKVVSSLASDGGAELMRIEKRIEAYRDAAWVRVHHTLVVTGSQKFTEFDRLAYRVPAPAPASWRVPATRGQAVVLDGTTPAVHQRLDEEYVVEAGGRSVPKHGRLAGAAIAEGPGGCAVAVRDFWQNYPKAFRAFADGIEIELCPDFDEGLYDRFPFEKEGHQLYYYLLGGRYRLKRGVSKTHELLVCFESAEVRSRICELFQRPLLGCAAPAWYCDSKAFYDVAPRDTERFPLYEEAIDKNLAAYTLRRQRQHDFGMMNYGDWYGERGTNWGNVEYDTQHAFFLEFIRSGNPSAFFLGAATELHNRDIDTVHGSDDPNAIGAVYVHQMCHVGEYYDKPVPGALGYPRGGYTVSHAWTEGHFDHYFLTGDRRSFETACAVADFFVRKELGRPYDFTSCRVPGWHLIMLASAYAATNDPYYLNAAKVVVQRVLETQDTEPRPLPAYQAAGRKPYQQGGWSRMMVPGHCRCEPRHRGNAGFMVAVLLSGLKYYYDATGDQRVRQAIIQGAHYLLDETYSDEVRGFRYTSCPNTPYRPGASPLMVEGIARAYLWTQDDRFRRVLTEALPLAAGGSSYGKGFSMYYRAAPRVLADLKAAGLTLRRTEQP